MNYEPVAHRQGPPLTKGGEMSDTLQEKMHENCPVCAGQKVIWDAGRRRVQEEKMATTKTAEAKPKERPPLWNIEITPVEYQAYRGKEIDLTAAGSSMVAIRVMQSDGYQVNTAAIPDEVWNGFIDLAIDVLVAKKREVKP